MKSPDKLRAMLEQYTHGDDELAGMLRSALALPFVGAMIQRELDELLELDADQLDERLEGVAAMLAGLVSDPDPAMLQEAADASS